MAEKITKKIEKKKQKRQRRKEAKKNSVVVDLSKDLETIVEKYKSFYTETPEEKIREYAKHQKLIYEAKAKRFKKK